MSTGPEGAPDEPAGRRAGSPRQGPSTYIPALNEALVGFAVGLILASVFAAGAEAATGYKFSSHVATPLAVTAADLIGLWIGLAGSAVYTSRGRGTGSLGRDFGWRVGAWWDVPLGAAAGLGSQYLLIPLLYLPFEHADRSLSRQLSQPAHNYSAAATSPVSVILLVALLAVGAPLVEELFFRGLLMRSLQTRIPTAPAILVSSLLFALAHFELAELAGLALFGVVLGVLAWSTGRLGASISAHMAFNAAVVAAVVHIH